MVSVFCVVFFLPSVCYVVEMDPKFRSKNTIFRLFKGFIFIEQCVYVRECMCMNACMRACVREKVYLNACACAWLILVILVNAK